MLSRRQLFAGAAGVATAASIPGSALPRPRSKDLDWVRADFPWAARETYLNCALEHPLSVHSSRAMQEYIGHLTHGPDAGRAKFENTALQENVRRQFANLIAAKPSEIAFVPSTQIGENLVIDGLGITQAGGNVVTNDLHYGGSLSNYRARKQRGLDVRVVKHRDFVMDMRDLERVVDRKTKLIAIALVSNINGYLHDIRAISELAHAHGAYVYVDVIQAVGAVPIDVRDMGVDFLACSAYKWLMGGRFGYLYVREEHHGGVMRPTQFGSKGSGQTDARQYQVSTPNHVGFVCQHEALEYIHKLGVENIRAHVRPLTARLRKEMPAIGYPAITPERNESPIISFRVRDPEATRQRLRRAGVIVSLGSGANARMRVSPSVFNHLSDVDRLIEALA